jgi:transcriptional regulator with XRE-family HTH domain
VTERAEGINLGHWLRRLRRRADLSQRELASKAGVPHQTVTRIESGATPDPRIRTVERLIAAAGGRLSIVDINGTEPPPVPYDHLIDAAERRYPPHLDVRPVLEAEDWWGSWWQGWYRIERPFWPATAPDYSFDLNRRNRDRRRGEHRPDPRPTP